jgi:hypothetical protein
MIGPMPERAFPRLKNRLLVEFTDGSGERQTAFSRVASVTGLFVVSNAVPSAADPQVIKVHVPRGIANLEGRVIPRTGPGGEAIGFAFSLKSPSDLFTDYLVGLQKAKPELVDMGRPTPS